MAGLLAWGAYFDLFGRKIDWRQSPLISAGLVAWLVLGAYCVGYGAGRKVGVRYAALAFIGLISAVTFRAFVNMY
jgi:hypothetical protein